MPGARRGLVAPQNTFLENIIRRFSGQRKYIQLVSENLSISLETCYILCFGTTRTCVNSSAAHRDLSPGRVAQSVRWLTVDACLTADSGSRVRSRPGPMFSLRLIMK